MTGTPRYDPRVGQAPGARAAPRRELAFTLIELLVALTIIATLTAIAIPVYHSVVERARVAHAIGDVRSLQIDISSLDALPNSLAEIGKGSMLDPWGNPYVYQPFKDASSTGDARKDRFLVPLNSDYDLYSMGKDGASVSSLRGAASHDDIIRANDGGYVGLASEY